MNELFDQVFSSLRAIWRYRWSAMISAWIIAMAGWIAIYKLPDRYEADARVYVDTQTMLSPLLNGLAVQPDLDQMVMMMSRRVTSRPNLEKVIRMADLDIGLRTESDRAKLIARLEKHLKIGSGGRENMYTISFVDKEPQVAKRVVDSLLKLFVEESHVDKRNDSESAVAFLDTQLERYSNDLLASENAIMAFKRRNIEVLSGNGQNYYQRLLEAKSELNKAELELKEAEFSERSIDLQLASVAEIPSLIPELGNKNAEEVPRTKSEIDSRILTLGQKLDDMRLRYTDRHPDIVAMQGMLVELRKRKDVEVALLIERREAKAKLIGPSARTVQAEEPLKEKLTLSLTLAKANVAAMRARVSEYQRRYAELKAAANELPRADAEFSQLNRAYEINRARYEDLLRRRESAKISGALEQSDANLDFRVIDPPKVPLKPNSPNRPLLMTLALLAGLAGGAGIAFLISQIRTTIRDERGLREATDLPVLGTVVFAWTKIQKRHRTWGLVAFLTSFVSLLSAYTAVMVLVLTASRV